MPLLFENISLSGSSAEKPSHYSPYLSKFLRQQVTLKHLELTDRIRITDDIVNFISKSNTITHLSFSNTLITDKQVTQIVKKMPQLTSLNLSQCSCLQSPSLQSKYNLQVL
jgi:hypothetical protein